MPIVTFIRADGLSFTSDGEESVEFAPEATVTSFEVERGVDVSDHSSRKNDSLRILSFVTRTPRVPVDGFVSARRCQEAVEFFESILGQPITCVIVSAILSKTVQNCVLERMPHRITRLEEFVFPLAFKVVRIGEAQLVRIPPLQPPAPSVANPTADKQVGFPDKTDVGEQPLVKALSEEKATEDDRSLLAQGIDKIFPDSFLGSG